MHHLARHAVACFLTRGDLYCPWTAGRDTFDRLLIDDDWSINNANWMWLSASAFFYQYHRVYSPITFGRKYDPNGDFVRKFVPELKVRHLPMITAGSGEITVVVACFWCWWLSMTVRLTVSMTTSMTSRKTTAEVSSIWCGEAGVAQGFACFLVRVGVCIIHGFLSCLGSQNEVRMML